MSDRARLRYLQLKAQQAGQAAPQQQPQQQAQVIEDDAPAENWAFDEMSGLEKFGVGLAKPIVQLKQGVEDMWGGRDEEEIANMEALEKTHGWEAGAGEMVSELGMLALPATKGLKGAAALAKAGKKGKALAATLGTEAGLSAGLNAAQIPETGETRGGQAVQGGVASLAGLGAGKLLGKAMSGLKRTPEADELIKKGVPLTPGKAAAGSLPRAMDTMLEWTPFAAKGVKEANEDMMGGWNKAILQEAVPPGSRMKINEPGHKAIKRLRKGYETGFKKAWSKAGKMDAAKSEQAILNATNKKAALSRDDEKILTGVLDEAMDVIEKGAPDRLQAFDDTLRKRIQNAGKQGSDLEDTFRTLRTELRGAASEKTQKALAKLEGGYGNYKAAQKASANAIRDDGVFTPDQLENAVKGVGKVARTAEGVAPLQQSLSAARKTVGRNEAKPLISQMKAMVQNTPTMLPVRTMGKAGIGETAPQKFAQKKLNPLIDQLRNYGVTGGTLGGAYEE